MTQDTLFLLLVAIAGIYAVRWTTRLARVWSEFPAKTLIATALAALVAATAFTALHVSTALRTVALVVGPLYVFGPLLLVVLARNRRYGAARFAASVLYWTREGRAAVGRLLAQAALQQGDAEAALQSAVDPDPLLLAQAYALQGAWPEVLALELPTEGDNAFLGLAARVEALVALDRTDEARAEVARMRQRLEGGRAGPIGFRSVVVSEARLDAEAGAFEKVRQELQQPLVGVRAHTLYAILARAAERAGLRDAAVTLYGHAYQGSPEGLRPRYAERLRALGSEPPALPRRRAAALATLTLGGALVFAYVAQTLVDRWYGVVRVLGQNFDLSSVTAAYLLNVPGIPSEHAWWRLLTYAFLHANLLHIGFNVWVLVDLGRLYEARRGWGNLLASFVAGTAMGAYLTSIAQAHQSVVLVGASGGILGVAGALLADALRSRSASDRALLRALVQWMVLIALFSVAVPNVSLWGHAGGVVGGLLWGFLRQGLPADRRVDTVVGVASVAVIAVALTSAIVVAIQTVP